MFGYVNVLKDELKVKDYNIYRSYYCGLCKTLGQQFSQKARLSLNYDFAFLALLLSSLDDDKMNINYENCIIHPFNKRPVLKDDKFLIYSAYMSVIVTYFKLKDDAFDLKNIKSIFSAFLFKGHLNKAKKRYPEKFEIIKELLYELNKKEKNKASDVDEVADSFGKLLSAIFTPDEFGLLDSSVKVLSNFGYNLGRFIYIIDALDDLKSDIKNKNYNPFIYKYSYNGEDIEEFVKKVYVEYDLFITLTLESIASAFELMDIKKNRSIIENIVYLGMRKTKDRVLKGE